MSNKILDLNTIVKDDLVIKLLDGSEVRIPGQVQTGFILELTKFEEKLEEAETTEESIEILIEIVTLILKQDPNAKITKKYVRDNLSDISILTAIMQGMVDHINEITNDKNL